MPFQLDEAVFAGESIQLNCFVAKGDSPIEIKWVFNDDTNLSNLKIVTAKVNDKTSLLTIYSVTGRHSGNYTCIASNAAGVSQHTAYLHVNGTCTYNMLKLHFSSLFIIFFTYLPLFPLIPVILLL